MEWDVIWTTIRLSGITVLVLFALGMPLAWWLANTHSRWKVIIEALTALPLVLPPTVLGFYMLLMLGADGVVGQLWIQLTGSPLAFTFTGLVIASCIYSLPFVVQPLQTSFESIDRFSLEAARILGADKTTTFIKVVLPQARRGIVTALVLGFAHTVGEFGVVLMVGGNIPGMTQVVSIKIYEQVETLQFAQAHQLSMMLLFFSFVVLLIVYSYNRNWRKSLRI